MKPALLARRHVGSRAPSRGGRSMLLGLCGAAVVCLLARPAPALVLTEIMYHSDRELGNGTEDKRFEWLEFYNENYDPVDLSEFTISDGVYYLFPPGTILRGRTYLVVAADPAAVESEYGITGVLGPWDPSLALSNGGETIALANVSGSELVHVEYNDRGRWPAGADGTGHSLAMIDPFLEPDDPDSWTLSAERGGTPGRPNFPDGTSGLTTTLIARGATWRYFKGVEAPPASWAQRGFDDGDWLAGATGIGYGDGDDATELLDMQGGYVTVFCRKQFAISDKSAIVELRLDVSYDDGFHIYLNGVRVESVNAVGTEFDDTSASTTNDPVNVSLDLTPYLDLLVEGDDNVLAASVHNAGLGSSDLSFIPELILGSSVPQGNAATVPVVINEALTLTGGDRWVELYNVSGSPVDLSGYHLTDDRRALTKSVIAQGTVIPGRGFLVLRDDEIGLNFSVTSPVARDRVFVALVNPSGERVVDAYSFEPDVFDHSEARLPDGDEDVAPAADPTPGAPNRVTVNSDIVINEILYNSVHGSVNNEFVEIYNRGETSVDLTGWRFTKGVDFDFPPGTTIPPDGYLVVARAPDRIRQVYDLDGGLVIGPETPEAIADFGLLRDRGERINLRDGKGNLVDTVRFFDGGEWPEWPDGMGPSLELIDPWQDNNVGAAWDASDDTGKSRVTTFSYSGTHAGGESEIHVLLLDRGITIVDDLQVSRGVSPLVSNPDFEGSTSGWRIEGNHIASGRTTDPLEVIAGSGSLKIIATGRGDNKVNRIESATSSLAARTQYTIRVKTRWVVGSKTILLRGYNHGMARRFRMAVPTNLGTPGAPNSVSLRQIDRTGSVNLGPVIDKVTQDPAAPAPGQPVRIGARVQDSDGVAPGSVKLIYALDSPVASFQEIVMNGPDSRGRYSATVPGQSSGRKVLFYVVAQDAPGQTGRFPVDHTLRTHPTMVDPADATVVDMHYLIYRHDSAPSGPYPSYRFVMHDVDQSFLWGRRVLSNEMIEGSFIFDGERIYHRSSVRFSGSPWLRGGNGWRKSYRVSMPDDDPLHGRIRGFNMENHGTDGRERLSHHLIRYNNRPGVPVPYVIPWYARWELNSVVSEVYEHMPKPDNDYLRFWFPDDDSGDFFEIDDRFEFNDNGDKVSNIDARVTFPPHETFAYTASDPENWRWFFNTRAKRDDDDYTSLINLSSMMDPSSTPTSTFDAKIEDYIHLEEFLRIWAVRMNSDDWDTWGTERGKNAYLYRRPSDQLWFLAPWDMELTYGTVGAFPVSSSTHGINTGKFPEVARLIQRPWVKRKYYGILKEMIDRQFRSSFLGPWVSANAAVGTGSLQHARPGGFIDTRRSNYIEPAIRSYVYPQRRFVIETNGGSGFSVNELRVDLDGAAPVEISTIRVLNDGRVLQPEPLAFFPKGSSLTDWALRNIPLLPGSNELELLGFDSLGNVVDSDTITVQSTVTWPAPTITGATPSAASAGETVEVAGEDFHQGIRLFFDGVEAVAVDFDELADPGSLSAVVPEGLPFREVAVTVRNLDGKTSAAFDFLIIPPLPKFIRGDANQSGIVDIGDAILVLMHTFRGMPVGCRQALDVDDSGLIEVTDGVQILEYLYLDGPRPEPPFPARGVDLTSDSLDCETGI